MSELDLNIDASRARQQRLWNALASVELDAIIVTQIEHIQYLVGPRFAWVHQPVAVLFADGTATLVAPNEPPAAAAADEILTYEAQWLCTLRNDQRQASSEVLLNYLKSRGKLSKIGVEYSTFSLHMSQQLDATLVDVEPTLYQLRRKKDPDELARLKKAIDGTARMYEVARDMVRPGVSELNVFNALQAAAVKEYGEMLTGTGNDYASGEKGGPPRDRLTQDGELYILDLGPAFRGYFADNCRTIAVNGKPTDEQQQAWEYVMQTFDHVKRTVRPGKSCKELFNEVVAILSAAPIGVFDHHLGHGIGLFPHEAPHLNSCWDDLFAEGDVFTVEPGLYDEKLRFGMRLENDYLVTSSGVELLSDFPIGLT
ncbi:Xaa-Pro peptidase family protein [Blastopirellula sp. JC732]|uniref:Xaa-Pro peptidase family protein n=1 Tax=Blastopirellula sediminis TaxID=2894196 RepID=A0A9X1MU16_9BACT|nr:Xaa-Pro peptidase family protein [Blastopirellula sediminis]MCC9604624.1 Xaa-Pro peptidase family protein [Blastopirellula sediminis]MCC9632077.1 Xaa-Pro peptidase family protein [Blastopirellula sediminis]